MEEILLEEYCDEPDENSEEHSNSVTVPLEVLDVVPTLKRLTWSEESLVKAIEAINEKGYSFYKASHAFNIPRSTLIRQWKANKTTKNKIGRKRILTPEQEDLLTRRIKRIININYPVTTDYLCRCVYKFCEDNQISHTFSKDKEAAGSYWLKNFLQRYPDILEKTKQKFSSTSLVDSSYLVVRNFFQKFQKSMEKREVIDQPQFIYNVECKSLKINLATGLANLRDGDSHQANQPDDEKVKIICASNAAGQAIPLMAIFKGEKLKNKWCKDFPLGAVARVTSDGSVTSDAFNEWLQHLQKYRSAGPCLLIINETVVNLDYSIIQVADQLGIALLCLPKKNSLQDLRPIYRGCFNAFDEQWAKEIQEFWKRFKMESEAFKAFSRQTFGKVLSAVWNKVMTSKNFKSGFRVTRLYPYDPEMVLREIKDGSGSAAVSSSVEIVDV